MQHVAWWRRWVLAGEWGRRLQRDVHIGRGMATRQLQRQWQRRRYSLFGWAGSAQQQERDGKHQMHAAMIGASG